jgi:hypothetical protein
MEDDVRLRRVQPDLTVSDTAEWQPGGGEALAVADAISTELEYPDFEPQKRRHLSIIHNASRRVVTVVELLSPSNKPPGDDSEAYREKRAELIASDVNLVEIDLLRRGERLTMRGQHPPGDYFVYIGRTEQRPRCQVIGWPLRAPMPLIPIPLLPDDDESTLDLTVTFRAAYEPAFYDRRLPYTDSLDPPPSEPDAEWLRQCLGASDPPQ